MLELTAEELQALIAKTDEAIRTCGTGKAAKESSIKVSVAEAQLLRVLLSRRLETTQL